MNFVSQLIRHIGSCITAEKGKRIFYAVVNIAFIAMQKKASVFFTPLLTLHL